jgi:hypothetical protein
MMMTVKGQWIMQLFYSVKSREGNAFSSTEST